MSQSKIESVLVATESIKLNHLLEYSHRAQRLQPLQELRVVLCGEREFVIG
jgi:hypothetical protein